jgi:molybdopterin converting factor small subunit
LFAVARQLAGKASLELELPDSATVGDVKSRLAHACPALAPLLPRLMIAVDSEYADEDRRIPPTADLAVIPPVSGG